EETETGYRNRSGSPRRGGYSQRSAHGPSYKTGPGGSTSRKPAPGSPAESSSSGKGKKSKVTISSRQQAARKSAPSTKKTSPPSRSDRGGSGNS
ncbi:MAG: hypothetical protein KDA79_21920, partial [Planctomycetaceae bacterium]|nr:hypothetical protein [Planctomycetaceae bacterium]